LTTAPDILATIQDMQRHGKRIGLVNGCYDLIHAGHVFFLRQAAHYCDHLVVGLNSDDSVRELKGPGRPYWDIGLRKMVLEELEPVGTIIEFDGDVTLLIAQVAPDTIIRGAGQHLTQYEKQVMAKDPDGIKWIEARVWSTSRTVRALFEAHTWEIVLPPETAIAALSEDVERGSGFPGPGVPPDEDVPVQARESRKGATYVMSIGEKHIFHTPGQWLVGHLSKSKKGHPPRFVPESYCATKRGLLCLLIDEVRDSHRKWLLDRLKTLPEKAPGREPPPEEEQD
jgi:rfaE bifunctional protein nucleotidyltransferase chain/domain